MEMEFDVQIKKKDLYEYQLHHAYTTPAGLLGTTVGIALIVSYMGNHYGLCLIAGLFLVLYFPWTLNIQSAKQAQQPIFKNPLHYKVSEEGLEVSQGEASQLVEWSSFTKAISTRTNIVLYTSKVNAYVFPQRELGQRTNDLVKIVSLNMPPEKVKIRGSI